MRTRVGARGQRRCGQAERWAGKEQAGVLEKEKGGAGHRAVGRCARRKGKRGECGWAGQQARPVAGLRARRRPGVGLEGKKESFSSKNPFSIFSFQIQFQM